MKTIKFQRTLNDILVEYKSTIRDVENVNENFIVSHPSKINSYIEKQLFYHFDRKKWTLNEMIFFAKNNMLCITILDSLGVEIVRYGECAGVGCSFKINTQCFVINNQFLKIN